MSTRTKNPLHPSALSLNDMHIGRRIIAFNTFYGVNLEGTVISEPFVEHFSYFEVADEPESVREFSELVVMLRSLNGVYHMVPLSEAGVIPFYGSNSSRDRMDWHTSSFVIDARKRALLPEVVNSGVTPAQEWEDYLMDDYMKQYEEASMGDWY